MMARLLLIILAMLIVSRCSIVEEVPTLVPELRIEDQSGGSSGDIQIQNNESPRPHATVGIPPTWTPTINELTKSNIPVVDQKSAAVEPEIAPGSRTHVVQAGDTLGEIAETYNVSIVDLVTANGIEDPDRIEVGQVLVIP